MSDLLFDRLLWTIGIIAAALLVYILVNRVILSRAGRKGTLIGIRRGTPAILYFTTPECAPCKTIQRPALSKVKDLFGPKLQVIEVNAAAQPEIAGQWGVMSVPTTFILDRQGQARFVNHGVTRAEKLVEQLQKVT